MIIFGKRRHVLRNAAGEGGDGGAPAGVPAAGAGGGEPSGPVAGVGAEPAAGAASGSALGVAAAQPAAFDWLPEKYRVAGADGVVDLDASARKLADAHGSLEKRLGAGDTPPKTAQDYVITVPDSLKEQVAEIEGDPFLKETRDSLHALGLTQKQFDGVMGQYWKIAPALALAGKQLDGEACTAELNKVWTDPATSKANFRHALVAATRVGGIAGVPMAEIESSGLANNPTFIRMMAAIGPEMGEDAAVAGEGSVLQSEQGVKALMTSDAYRDSKHPQHAETVAKVRSYYNRVAGSNPVV